MRIKQVSMKRTYSAEDRSSLGQVQSFRDRGGFSSLDQGILLEASVSAETRLGGSVAVGFESEFAVFAGKASTVDPLKFNHYNGIMQMKKKSTK